ncbi:Alpha/Beta hydrolase protein [Phaeosphaeriaceae sp. PMI808]|nr:Alpha/Beta hydrolase protein [Phaeosphaeriaceae sp. PMI808]
MPGFTLDTDHGLISIIDTAPNLDTPTLLLLHGNSSSSKIFRHIIGSPVITKRWRVLSFCLPGHGSSSKAPTPAKTYHMRGYAELSLHILQHLNIENVIVFGWSLGGHIGIELLDLLKAPSSFTNSKRINLKGLMITGTPPALGKEQIREGFTISETSDLGFAGWKDWTDEEAMAYSKSSATADVPDLWEPWMYEDAKNTDGRARMIMARNFTGSGEEGPVGVDQRKLVETEDVLIAVVNGASEPFVSLDYLDGIKWKRLWKGKCIRLPGLHHTPFWEDPSGFEKILVEFATDAEIQE